GVLGHSSDLFRRVTMLLQEPLCVEKSCPRRWSLAAAGGLLSLAVIASGIGLSAEPAPAAPAEPGPAKPDARVVVVPADRDKAPAKVEVRKDVKVIVVPAKGEDRKDIKVIVVPAKAEKEIIQKGVRIITVPAKMNQGDLKKQIRFLVVPGEGGKAKGIRFVVEDADKKEAPKKAVERKDVRILRKLAEVTGDGK